jgi:hypothetical protein
MQRGLAEVVKEVFAAWMAAIKPTRTCSWRPLEQAA